jgi:non-ribosomal peptide synthetase component F
MMRRINCIPCGVSSVQPVDGLASSWRRTTAKEYPLRRLMPLLEANAALPDHPAVIYENGIETYGAFNAKVNRLAHLLLELGCGRDRLVGLCLDRSLHLPAAVWAVLKAGGAYVPLAVDDPDLRLKELIDDAGPEIILCDAATAPRLRPFAKHVIIAAEAAAAGDRPDRNPGIGIDADQLAYTIFTSGSTGRPKGVMVEHGQYTTIVWMQDRYRLGQGVASCKTLRSTYRSGNHFGPSPAPPGDGATRCHRSPNYR